MQTARFVSKLVDNIEQNYQTVSDPTDLLRSSNLSQLSDYVKHGTGIYIDTFIDDMALTRTIVTSDVTDEGRIFYNLDIAVVKFDAKDKQLILDLFKDRFLGQLAQEQNGGKLANPLPELKLT